MRNKRYLEFKSVQKLFDVLAENNPDGLSDNTKRSYLRILLRILWECGKLQRKPVTIRPNAEYANRTKTYTYEAKP